jgi:signal transduction histidine kinase
VPASDRSPRLLEQSLWALAVTLPLCLRRVQPVPVLVAVSAAFIGLQVRLVFEGFITSICLFLAVFTVGAWARDRRLADAARLVVVVAMFAWLGISLSTTAWGEHLRDVEDAPGVLPPLTATLIYTTATNVVYFAAAWVFGDRAWRHARDRADLVARNAELAREREENARRAVVEERVRIARELHDVVAHHVSVMGVQAGAARHVLDRQPEAARVALAGIEESSRLAIGEMRQLLGVLRAADLSSTDGDGPPDAWNGVGPSNPPAVAGDLAPPPGLADIPALVARVDHPGLTATFAEIGEPCEVPPLVGVSLYRLVQEALTNTVKHARARQVDVRLRWPAGEVEIEVVDDGRGTADPSGPGLGLTGMQERVTMHGGTFEAGPRPIGGFRVRARIPVPLTAVVTSA